MHPFRVISNQCSWPCLARTMLTFALIGHVTMSFAEDTVKVSPEQMQSLGVRLTHPVSSRTDQTLPYPAQIVIPTPQLWVVSAPVAGMVAGLSVARGDRAVLGQRLVTLQSSSFVSLQRDYLHAAAQDILAAQQLRRNTELFEGKAVPQRVVETSQTEARQASIAVAERRQMLRLSGLSEVDISRLTDEAAITATLSVAAPEPATVVEIVVSPGQRVDQSAPLVKLARLSPLWAEIAIPASSIRAIRPGARVEVDGYATPGQVVLVSETTDTATQTVLVRAEVPNNGELRPGQTAAVRIDFLSPAKAPGKFLTARWSGEARPASIFVAIEGGFRLIQVTLLAEDQDHVVVAGELTRQGRGGGQRHLRAARHPAGLGAGN